MIFDPGKDGIDHINIYSQGKTELGIWLSNFSYCNIELSIGNFKSIEGLIYFLGSFDESLRSLYGYKAKSEGQKLDRNIRLPKDIFQNYIKMAMEQKLKSNSDLSLKFIFSELPFTHYYNYKGKIVVPRGWNWQIEYWEKLRKDLK